MKFIKNIFFLGLLVLISACKKELPFPDINSPKNLVINSTFTPDTMAIHISESCHVANLDCQQNIVTDALVEIKDESGNVISNLEHQGEGIYILDDASLSANKKYKLEVSRASDPSQNISSESKIPKDFTCNFISASEKIINSAARWIYEVEIIDNPDEENYYLLEGYYSVPPDTGAESESGGYIEPQIGIYSLDIYSENKSIYSAYDYVDYPLRSAYLPDANFNGTAHKTQFIVFQEGLYNSGELTPDVHLIIKSVSKEMYDHHKSIENYLFSQSNIFAEPTIVSTNISNGLGIFAGYNQKEFVITLPESEFYYPSNITIDNNGCTGPCAMQFSIEGDTQWTYNWDFGDGGTSTEMTPEHSYTSPGNYTVNLTVNSSEEYTVTARVL